MGTVLSIAVVRRETAAKIVAHGTRRPVTRKRRRANTALHTDAWAEWFDWTERPVVPLSHKMLLMQPHLLSSSCAQRTVGSRSVSRQIDPISERTADCDLGNEWDHH